MLDRFFKNRNIPVITSLSVESLNVWIAALLVTVASLSFGLTLQYTFCARMGNDVELPNRIRFSLIVFPLTFLFIQFCIYHLFKARFKLLPSLFHRGTWWAMAPVIALSPLIRLFPNFIFPAVAGVFILSAGAFALYLYRCGKLAQTLRNVQTFTAGLARVHYFFIAVFAAGLFVFTAEINEDFAVFESDGPYYGHFAQNILRYDVDYTWFLRTHGSGDIQEEKTGATHNLRHPTGFTTAIVAYYLFVGSDASPPVYRIFSLIINLLTLILIYRLILKKTASPGYAAFSVLMYLLVPIAVGFNMKIHQMVALNFGAFFLIYLYDKMITSPENRKLKWLFYAMCFLTLHIDWYMMLLYPMFWVHYIIFVLRKKRDLPFIFILPVLCILSTLLMLLQMYVAVESFAALEGIYNLRFENHQINSVSTYKFLFDMSNYIVIHFTLIISVLGLLWPVNYIWRLRKGDRHPLDWITLFALAYGVINMMVFKKTRTHYFEVVHFLPYVTFAIPFLSFRMASFVTRLPFARNVLLIGLMLCILPQTIDGLKVFRFDTYRPYVTGFADAMDYVNGELASDDTVLINWAYHRYKNERYLIRNKKLFCNTLACLNQATTTYKFPRYAILFRQKQNRPLFAKLLSEGAVRYFREQVATVDLSQSSNVIYTDRNKALAAFKEPTVHQLPFSESVFLVASRLDTPTLQIKSPQPALHKYFQSWDEKIKEPVEYQNTLSVSYLYTVSQKQAKPIKFNTVLERVTDDSSPIVYENYQSNYFYPVEDWQAGTYIRETISFDLGEHIESGFYNVYITAGDKRVFIDTLKVTPRRTPKPFAMAFSSHFVPHEEALYSGMTMVGFDVNPRAVAPGRRVPVTVYLKKTAAFEKEKSIGLSAAVGNTTFNSKPLKMASPFFWETDKVYAATAYFSIPEYVKGDGFEVRLNVNGASQPLFAQSFTNADDEWDVLASVSPDKNPLLSQQIAGGEIHDLTVSQVKTVSKNPAARAGKNDIEFNLATPVNVRVIVETFPEDEKRGFTAKLRSGNRQSFVDGFYMAENESHKVEQTVIKISRKQVRPGKNLIHLESIPAPQAPRVLYGWRSYLVPFMQPYIDHFWGTNQKLRFPAIRNITVIAKKPDKPGYVENLIDKLTARAPKK